MLYVFQNIQCHAPIYKVTNAVDGLDVMRISTTQIIYTN